MAAVRESIGKLDTTLIEAADRARTSSGYQINRLHRRASRAELLRNEVITRPRGCSEPGAISTQALQEREVAG